MNYEKIGEFIAEKRKEKNLTQVELAKKLGVTDKAVSKWERGLGCPDVSILEILSKELDVSILELLKGRKIENEVINITEADDYIKESIKVTKLTTKDKIYDSFSKVIFYLVTFISLVFIILSITNYYQSSYGQKIYIDEVDISMNDDEANRLQDNIEKLKESKGIFKEETKEALVKDLEMLIDYNQSQFTRNLDENKRYTANDIMFLYIEDIMSPKYPRTIITDFIHAFEEIGKKDEYKTRAIKANMYHESLASINFLNYYKDNNQRYFNFQTSNALIPVLSIEYFGEDKLAYSCDMLLSSMTDKMKLYNLFVEDMLKEGAINE